MAGSPPRSGEIIQGVNVTPLVDVVLVLLIVLMVTASYSVSRALPLSLPRAGTGEPGKSAPLSVGIDRSGALSLNGEAVSKAELELRVRKHRSEEPPAALIAADGAAEHRAVVAVIDLLRGAGISRIAINVAPEDSAP